MIAILCPSRGRPERFTRMLESAVRTAKNKFEVLAYVDDDDPTRGEYEATWANVYVGPRIDLGPSYEVLRKRTTAGIVMMGADDLVFRTMHWDVLVEEAAPKDLISVVSFDDGGNTGAKEDGHPFIGRGFIDAIGGITNPDLGHCCIDNWVVEIAKNAECFKRLDLLIEHLHPKYRKAEWDQTYKDNSKAKRLKDGKTFAESKHKIQSIAQRLKMIRSTGRC